MIKVMELIIVIVKILYTSRKNLYDNDYKFHDQGHGTYNRYRKDSFYWYKKVIENHGEDLD